MLCFHVSETEERFLHNVSDLPVKNNFIKYVGVSILKKIKSKLKKLNYDPAIAQNRQNFERCFHINLTWLTKIVEGKMSILLKSVFILYL